VTSEVVESWQSYANVVGGVTRNLRQRASATTWALLGQVGLEEAVVDTGERIAKLAEEIGNASRANRELLENLIVAEVDKAATRLGFVRTEDLDELRAEVAELRAQVQDVARAGTATRPAPARKSAMKKAADSAAAAG
jgi:predicted RNA-binding Zn ribbon-like protein